MHAFFTLPAERTESSDAIYGAIGRALTFATQFESNCRALAVLFGLKKEVAENQLFSLSNQEDIDQLVAKLQSPRLAAHIKAICIRLGVEPEISEILHRGRNARNLMAHEFTLGLEYKIEDDASQGDCITRLRSAMRDLAEANLIVSVLSLVVTHEELPTSEFLRRFVELVGDWYAILASLSRAAVHRTLSLV